MSLRNWQGRAYRGGGLVIRIICQRQPSYKLITLPSKAERRWYFCNSMCMDLYVQLEILHSLFAAPQHLDISDLKQITWPSSCANTQASLQYTGGGHGGGGGSARAEGLGGCGRALGAMEDWGLRALEGERRRLVGVGSGALGCQCDGSVGAGGGHWEAEDLGDLPLEGSALRVSVHGEIGMCIRGLGGSGPCCQVPGHSLGAWAEHMLSALGPFCPRGCHLRVGDVLFAALLGPVADCRGFRFDPFASSSPRVGPRLPLRDAALGSSMACSALGTLVPGVLAWLLLGTIQCFSLHTNPQLYPVSNFPTHVTHKSTRKTITSIHTSMYTHACIHTGTHNKIVIC